MARSAGAYTRPAKRVRVEIGPFAGMRDRRPPSAPADESFRLAYMENVWVRDPANPSGVELRPAFSLLAATPGARTAQGFLEHIDTTGTRRLFQTAGGKLYRFNAPAWSDVSPAATMSSAARWIYMENFAGKLIVSDGVNKPWSSPTGVVASTVINVDSVPSAWAAYGPPVVYAGKLVFIKAGDRTRIVWSEEADETTGYEQDGFANYWSLTQADAAPLTALAATNDALYFFRPGSIGAVYGAISSDFATAHTDDAVSQTHGTIAPASVKVIGNEVWFLDRSGFPAVITPGGGVTRFESDALEALVGLAPSTYPPAQEGAWTEYDPARGLVYMAVPTVRSATLNAFFVFHAQTKTFLGLWKLPGAVALRAAGAYYSGTNYDETKVAIGDTAGNVWFMASPIDTVYAGRDLGADGVTYAHIAGIVETEPILGSPSAETRWDLVTAAMRIPTDNASLTRSFAVSYRVPRSDYGTPQSVTATAVYSGADARGVVGILAQGRSLSVRIANTSTNPGRFLLDRVAVEGTALPPNAVSY